MQLPRADRARVSSWGILGLLELLEGMVEAIDRG